MAYFSSQASVEARASSQRLLLWTDKTRDGVPDTAVLNAGFERAQDLIYEHLKPRYGDTELLAWQTTLPDSILKMSDDLCLWEFGSTNPAVAPLARQIREDVIARLEAIADYRLAIYGVDEGYATDFETESQQAIYDDELTDRLALSAAEEED